MLKGLNDDHAPAATRTALRCIWLLTRICIVIASFASRIWRIEQLPRPGDVGHPAAIGKQSVVPDAVQAIRQNVDEKSADELVGSKRHGIWAVTAFMAFGGPIILPLEGDAVVVGGNQTAVCAGDAVGIARQIGEHLARPGEGTFCVDHPFAFGGRREIIGEGVGVDERNVCTKELQTASFVGHCQLLDEQPAEQP